MITNHEFDDDGTNMTVPLKVLKSDVTFTQGKTWPVILKGGCNTTDEVILEQVKINIRRQLPQVQPYMINHEVAVIVGGGPSLKETEKELLDCYWRGGKIVALNGAYRWCIERNIKPSACIVLDARESNAEFVKESIPECKYLLASQCHSKTFEYCAGRDVYIWHACTGGDNELKVLKKFYFGRVHPVDLGTTVGIRSVSLMRMLGFTRMEIFGIDSCWLDDNHHSYEQPENNRDLKKRVWLVPSSGGDAVPFMCAPWHMQQVEDFKKLIKERGNMFQLNVHGRGLLATILRTGATIQQEENRNAC
jgi:uncharacterized Rossmann fold enzyme